MQCDEEEAPADWRSAKGRRVRCPVRRLWNSLHGGQRGGVGWGKRARKAVEKTRRERRRL